MLHWDKALIRCNCYFSFSAIFRTLTPFTAQKMKISQKWKKPLEVSTFTTSVPKTIIICFIVPEIWHLTEVIVSFHFGLFLAILPPLTAQKMKISKQWKKPPGYIIILHKCTKNHDHMLYCFWDIVCDGCICYFSFWAIFLPFYPSNSPKNENFKTMEEAPGDIIILHICTKDAD